jgi:hypothetical protein
MKALALSTPTPNRPPSHYFSPPQHTEMLAMSSQPGARDHGDHHWAWEPCTDPPCRGGGGDESGGPDRMQYLCGRDVGRTRLDRPRIYPLLHVVSGLSPCPRLGVAQSWWRLVEPKSQCKRYGGTADHWRSIELAWDVKEPVCACHGRIDRGASGSRPYNSSRAWPADPAGGPSRHF